MLSIFSCACRPSVTYIFLMNHWHYCECILPIQLQQNTLFCVLWYFTSLLSHWWTSAPLLFSTTQSILQWHSHAVPGDLNENFFVVKKIAFSKNGHHNTSHPLTLLWHDVDPLATTLIESWSLCLLLLILDVPLWLSWALEESENEAMQHLRQG